MIERMASELVTRAHWGDLTGMNFAGLVRMSFEKHDSDGEPKTYVSGRDIKGRDEQEKDCGTYVQTRKGNYVYTYEEPNTTAFRRKRVVLPDGRAVFRVVRPILEGALNDLKRGHAPNGEHLDGLIVYDIDRLTRDNRHLEDCIEVVQHFGRPIIDITGTLDLLTDNGRTVARIVVATNNKQSADTARRVSRKHVALQQAGIPAGGRRPYGWEKDKRTINAAEAKNIRDGVDRLLNGVPINGLLAQWKQQGVVTTTGRLWVRQTLLGMLRNPRLCGYRARLVNGINPKTGMNYRDWEIVRNAEGEPIIGQWTPILTVEEWEAVTAIVGRNSNHDYDRNTRKYLLTNVLLCGKPDCGKPLRPMKVPPKEAKILGEFHYMCRLKKEGGCGGMCVYGPKTDEWITEAVIAKYELEAKRRQAEIAPEPWSREAELAEVRASIKELTAAWRARPQKISNSRYFAFLPELEHEEAELAAEREQWLARQIGSVGHPPALRVDWPGLTLAEKRTFVREALVGVLVHPAREGWREFDPSRFEPLWREES
jgi:DNA invertase Pin-like site-specific DNA recombinase